MAMLDIVTTKADGGVTVGRLPPSRRGWAAFFPMGISKRFRERLCHVAP